MVRTLGFHPEDPGSIPHAGDFFLNFNSDTYFQSSANSLSAAYYSFQHSVHLGQQKYAAMHWSKGEKLVFCILWP